LILDKFGRAGGASPVDRSGTGDAPPAEAKSTTASKAESKAESKATPGQRDPAASEVKCTT